MLSPRKLHIQILPALLFGATCLLLSSCSATNELQLEKIRGISLESPSAPSRESVMKEISGMGADYVCIMPYGYLQDGSAEVKYDMEKWQWWGERSEGVEELIHEAHTNGLQVMLKPHIWINWGDYTGDLQFMDPISQKTWSESYRAYLLHYARIAQKEHVRILCIGTELCLQLNDDPDYWADLIDEVSNEYKGILTYASNWDCYEDFPHWDKLGFIGIDAYFPLAERDDASMDEVKEGWQYWKSEMERFAAEAKRPVLFTEYGYRSVGFALREPWEMSRQGEPNDETQSIGYEALYTEIWGEEWFAGGFLWKWHCKEHLERRSKQDKFTPQGKPSLELIKEHYRSVFKK